MKNKFIITSLMALLFATGKSQVAIGKTSVTNTSVSLEFGSENRGLLLPWVTSTTDVVGAENGTIIFDSADKKVKYLKAGAWFDLSVNPEGIVDTSLQISKVENSDARVVIGKYAPSDATPGILVLSDKDKAMVLPKVANPHLNIIDPSPGMMVYDTVSHQLATFNGTVWSFWKGI